MSAKRREKCYLEERGEYINGGLDLGPRSMERLHAEPLIQL
jgi:hypothetical protein